MTIMTAILAGGRSTRMRCDKALVRIGSGQTVIEAIAGACARAGFAVSVIGRGAPEDWDGPPAVFVRDSIADRGPLAGIATALARLPRAFESALVVSCDMPLLDERALRWLADAVPKHGRIDGLVSVDADGRLQPLFAVYHRACAGRAWSAAASEQRAILDFIRAGDFGRAPIPPSIAPMLASFNTPAELAAIVGDAR